MVAEHQMYLMLLNCTLKIVKMVKKKLDMLITLSQLLIKYA